MLRFRNFLCLALLASTTACSYLSAPFHSDATNKTVMHDCKEKNHAHRDSYYGGNKVEHELLHNKTAQFYTCETPASR